MSIVVVVNLDPHHVQSGWVKIPIETLELDPEESYQAHDLLTGARFLWHGERNYVELDPQTASGPYFSDTPAHPARAGFRLFHVTTMKRKKKQRGNLLLADDPLWYKDAVIYELHVRAFPDGNADGIGDFKGLTEKLDYLHDLGVTALWLLPFYPSPLKDDGYDMASYTEIHPDYGTLKDFKVFLREAHRRGLRVITELVINHTSDQHPWFQRARRAAPGSKERDFYVWSDSQEKYKEARIIFKDFETSNWAWDPARQGVLLASLLFSSARFEFRQSRR